MDLDDYDVFLSHGTMFKVAYRSLSLLCCIHHLKVLAHAIGNVLIFVFFRIREIHCISNGNTPEFPLLYSSVVTNHQC